MALKTKKDRLRAWVRALRSGKYRQGKGQLKRGNNYCCLGVASEVYARETEKEWNTGGFLLDCAVMKWFGLDSENPIICEISASSLNDGDDDGDIPRHSFKQIANLIEKHFKLKPATA